MQGQMLEVAVISEHAAHAEGVAYVAADKGWKVLTISSQVNPLQAVKDQQVDLVLVDLDLPNAIALLGELTQQLPYMPLLALTTAEHLVDWQDARLAGAMDYVIFPINAQHFFATIERVLQHFFATLERVRQVSSAPPLAARKERMIAVVSLKGGVGRSTLAANLAVALRQQKRGAVILAEAHHGVSHLSLMLNLHPRHTLASLATETNLDLDFIQGLLQTHSSGVRLLAAPSELAQVVEIERESWQRALALLSQLATYVVVDTAATTDGVLSEVLIQADEILVVTGPEIASLYSTLALLALLRAETNVHARLHVVLNQAGVGGGLSAATIEQHLGEKIRASIPTDPPLATYALNRGVPFVTSHGRAPISRALHQLVNFLLAGAPTAAQSKPQRLSSFLNFLGQRKQTAGSVQ